MVSESKDPAPSTPLKVNPNEVISEEAFWNCGLGKIVPETDRFKVAVSANDTVLINATIIVNIRFILIPLYLTFSSFVEEAAKSVPELFIKNTGRYRDSV